MKQAFQVLTTVLAIFLVVYVARAGYWSYTENPRHGLRALIDVIQSSSQFAVSEGLPHPAWEREVFLEEMQKPHVVYRDHRFYEGHIDLSERDRKTIEDLFTERELVPSSWKVVKMCGGFHPDFRVVWRTANGSEAEALVCFACNEVHVYSGVFRCKFGVPQTVEDRIEALWWPYRLQRPEPKVRGRERDEESDPTED